MQGLESGKRLFLREIQQIKNITKVTYQHNELVSNMRNGFIFARVVYDEGVPVDFLHLEVNAGYERMTGLGGVVGKKISEIFPGITISNSELVERQIRVAESGNPDRFELYVDSLKKWFDLSVYCPNRGYFIALIDDITSRKEAELMLLRSETRFRTLFERNAAAKLIVDPENANIVDANHAASVFYGWSVEELKQMNLAQINVALQLEVIKGNLARVVNEGYASFSFCHTMKDGSLRDVDVLSTKINDGNKDLIDTIIYDITEKKRYEQINAFRLNILQMADSHSIEELLVCMLDEAEKITGSEIGFVHVVDDDQRTLLFQVWSTNTLQKMCKAEGNGRHFALNEAGIWADAIREQKVIIHNDYSAVEHGKGMPEGHAAIVRQLVLPVNRDEKIVAIVGVGNKPANYDNNDVTWIEMLANQVWDIVAKKIADEEKRRLATQLQQASRMVMIGQLAAGVAHEINNPLNFITLNAHTILEDFNDLRQLVDHHRRIIEKGEHIPALAETVAQLREEEKACDIDDLLNSIPKALERLQNGIGRISTITNSMRNYSFKNEKEQLSGQDLNKAILDALDIAKHECSEIATLILQLDELPPLLCNPSQINQVILNLIINASHAIQSQNRTSPGKIEIITWASDESIFCSVSDDGPGIAKTVINRVFEPFFTTKDPGKGTGLGLSISYDIIVNKHKGSFSATNLAEGGTTFTFSLPLQIAPQLLLQPEAG